MIRAAYDVNQISTLAAWRRLAQPLEAASDALARLDERLLRSDPVLAEGVRRRGDFFDAQATIHLAGGLVALEDLVLHDSGMDVRRPTPELARAASVLATRRRLARSAPGWAFSPEGWRQLTGSPIDAPETKQEGRGPWLEKPLSSAGSRRRELKPWDMPRFGGDDLLVEDDDEHELEKPELVADEDDAEQPHHADFAEIDAVIARSRRSLAAYNELTTEPGRARLTLRDPAFGEEDRLAAWRRIALVETRELPAVLAAAVALDAWYSLDPSEHRAQLGPLFAASLLRARGKILAHLPALALGLRQAGVRRRAYAEPVERLEGVVSGVEEAARHAQRDLDKLTLAREVMLQRCKGRRKNCRLPQLVDLFVATPLVTVATAAKALKASPQAIEGMLAELGPACPRELTERRRYRAWGIV